MKDMLTNFTTVNISQFDTCKHVKSCLTCENMLNHFSCVQPCEPMDCGQAPLSMRFSRHKYWSGVPCTSPGDLPDPWTKPVSLRSPALAAGFFTTSTEIRT